MRRSERAWPNPSVEARPNGVAPGPVWRYAYIFARPGLAPRRWARLTSNVRAHVAMIKLIRPRLKKPPATSIEGRILFLAIVAATLATGCATPEIPQSSAQRGLGESLAKSKNCMACHSLSKPLVGPSFVNVARRYLGNNEALLLLQRKILVGGTGAWGLILSPAVAVPPDPVLSTLACGYVDLGDSPDG